MPQFLSASPPFLPQVAVLEATFVTLAILDPPLYAVLASAARERLKQAHVRRIVNRTGSTMLIGAGALAVGLRPAAS